LGADFQTKKGFYAFPSEKAIDFYRRIRGKLKFSLKFLGFFTDGKGKS
jgi:uncharacterized protein YecE (DUF72 family)